MRLALLAAAATLIVGSPTVEASSLVARQGDDSSPTVILVAQGCGLGYSRGTYGRCRPSVFGFGAPGGPRYGYRPYAYRPYGYGERPYGDRPYGY